MVKSIGRNINKYDSVNAPVAITLNTSTFTTLLTANDDRLGYKITNDTSHDIIVKEAEFDDPDALDRGFKIFKRSLYETKPDNIAVSEISAKAVTGSPEVLVVEE